MMTIERTPAAEHPPHVPAELAWDFDFYKLPEAYADDVHAYWKAVQDSYPSIFWTPRYGGHWVATRAEDIRHIQTEYPKFSNRETFIPKAARPRLIPVQLDPPEHGPFRKVLMPYFTPKALAGIDARVREVAVEIIEELKPKGECEFVGDFAGVMPIVVFMEILGLPAEDARTLRQWVKSVSGNNGTPERQQRAHEGWGKITHYLLQKIAERKATAVPGLINDIVHGQVEGRPLTDAEILSLCLIVVGGGLDTVVMVTSFAAHHLANHPEDRRYLRDNPGRLGEAVEELMRRFAPTNLGREVREDMVYKGLDFRAGEQILLPFPLVGLDDRVHADPLKVDFRRASSQHAGFGAGPHMCVGAALARREIRIFLEEWLTRIPEFRVKEGTRPSFATATVNTISDLCLSWEPAR